MRRAIGYVRVSTEMQAEEGLSMQAQRAAIKDHCARHGLLLVGIFEDVASGAKAERPGLLRALQQMHSADVLIVVRFDRLSRSLRHFCNLFDQHFADGSRELVALRENIRLDSALGEALVNLLLTFAQLERRATGERVRDSIRHRRRQGFHWGKVPYGKRAVPAPAEPRCKVLIDEPEHQAVIARLKSQAERGETARACAEQLNAEGIPAPQGERWTTSSVYGQRRRLGIARVRPHNIRWHTDAQARERLVTLRARGLIYREVAATLNTEGFLPLKGRAFTEAGARQLLRRTKAPSFMSPRQWLELHLLRLERAHDAACTEEPFARPTWSAMARLLEESGFRTPRGHLHWWPSQVREVLDGRFDRYYLRAAMVC